MSKYMTCEISSLEVKVELTNQSHPTVSSSQSGGLSLVLLPSPADAATRLSGPVEPSTPSSSPGGTEAANDGGFSQGVVLGSNKVPGISGGSGAGDGNVKTHADSEVGSDSIFRRASVESGVMSELINNEGSTVFVTEMSSGKVDSENSSYYESVNASCINASWEGAGTSWSTGRQQSSVGLGVLTEAEYKKQSEPKLDEFAWLYMEHGQDCNDSGGSAAGNYCFSICSELLNFVV
jgi:hypothetical protein